MDDADRSDERISLVVEAGQRRISEAAAAIPKGEPGECELCGEWCGRLVNGACARCRDKYRMK